MPSLRRLAAAASPTALAVPTDYTTNCYSRCSAGLAALVQPPDRLELERARVAGARVGRVGRQRHQLGARGRARGATRAVDIANKNKIW